MAATILARELAPAHREDVLCSHCGLVVPAGLIKQGHDTQFCCAGCRTAYDVIRGCGLDRYYRVREAAEAEPAPVKSTGKRYGEMDDALFASLYVKPAGTGLCRVELFLEGVHCAACVWLVERLPSVVKGVVEARLDLRRSLVRVVWDPSQVKLSAVARVLDSLGYPPHPARDSRSRSVRRVEDRRMLIRLAVAGACAGNVMLLALALYSGAFSHMEAQYQHLFRWLSMMFSVVSLAWPGSVFFRGAGAAIRTRTAHLDLPIAVGLAAGGVWGVVNTVLGRGEIYFDSLSVLVFALLVGRLIQHRQQRWSSDAIELLFSLTPTSTRRVEGGRVVEVPVEALSVGDTVEVLAGESFPVDGVVEQGESSIDQSLLTGESLPVAVRTGDAVPAGAVSLSGVVRVRVAATGEATRIGRLLKMVEEGTRRRAPIVRLADRIASVFVVAMLSLAALTAGAWLFLDPANAIDHAVALLIVTCPCALGLATPLAITVAIGRGAQRGILIKGGDAVESLAKPGKDGGVIFLDKTGTLTQGRMTLVSWHGPEHVKPMVAAVEGGSSHPIARALVQGLAVSEAPDVVDLKQETGLGITGRVDGREIVVGSSAFVRSVTKRVGPGVDEAESRVIGRGLAPVVVAVDGEAVAVAGVGDPLREDSRRAIDAMRAAGWDVRILSGDHPAVVRAAAGALGIENAVGGATPEDKLRIVTEAVHERGRGGVVMVGDGVNDAAALAAATVGIAVHGGAEASLAAADVYLSRPGVGPVAELLDASRRTLGVIRLNLAVSIGYNATAAALAMTGVITPLIAAILMPASSLTVLTLSFRLRTFRSKPCR